MKEKQKDEMIETLAYCLSAVIDLYISQDLDYIINNEGPILTMARKALEKASK